MNKFELVINHAQEIPIEKIAEYKSGLEKIKNNIPIQYITNHQEFMKMDFYVDESVLIPQPDTEILVEEVIKYAQEISENSTSGDSRPSLKILDLCTGSGAIAISLAKYIDNAEITATDISSKAIQVAKLNAEKNLVHKKISFIESDMFEKISQTDFNIIVSNPPYIETDVINTLSMEVQHEPKIALDGGADGLYFYKKIIEHSSNHLTKNGTIFLEIGYNQKQALFDLINHSDNFCMPTCVKDFGGNDRVIICRRK